MVFGAKWTKQVRILYVAAEVTLSQRTRSHTAFLPLCVSTSVYLPLSLSQVAVLLVHPGTLQQASLLVTLTVCRPNPFAAQTTFGPAADTVVAVGFECSAEDSPFATRRQPDLFTRGCGSGALLRHHHIRSRRLSGGTDFPLQPQTCNKVFGSLASRSSFSITTHLGLLQVLSAPTLSASHT